MESGWGVCIAWRSRALLFAFFIHDVCCVLYAPGIFRAVGYCMVHSLISPTMLNNDLLRTNALLILPFSPNHSTREYALSHATLGDKPKKPCQPTVMTPPPNMPFSSLEFPLIGRTPPS